MFQIWSLKISVLRSAEAIANVSTGMTNGIAYVKLPIRLLKPMEIVHVQMDQVMFTLSHQFYP